MCKYNIIVKTRLQDYKHRREYQNMNQTIVSDIKSSSVALHKSNKIGVFEMFAKITKTKVQF